MATSSPRRTDACLETGCLSSTLSLFGKIIHEPAPQGPGFPLHDPSVNATTVLLDMPSSRLSTTFLDSCSCALVLEVDEP